VKLFLIALLFAAFASPAGDPPGFQYWSAADLKGIAKTLAPKINEQKVATQIIANNGIYSFMAAHREGPGEAEYHETQADIFFVQSGEATLTYGGSLVDARTTAPNEKRAPSINGGAEKKLAAGDVVAIPAKLPHQVKLSPGKKFDYLIVKVTQ
jgi:mannose-6-phosphate isomerase-like protein (cupin superfamily)